MRAALWFLVLATLTSTSSYAAEMLARVANQSIGASVSGLPFPDTLNRDLASGFDNRIFLRVSVVASGKIVARRDAVIVAKYDLWEERFSVRKFVGDVLVSELTFKRVSEVMEYLGHLEFDSLFVAAAFQQGQDIALQADVSINPVEREKIERVRKWVAGNSTPADPAGTPLTTKPNDLFNKIFDQYTRGEDIVATWKMTIASKVFKPHLQQEAIAK